MKIKITKLKELEDARHSKNLKDGYETIQVVNANNFEEPKVGGFFDAGDFHTGKIMEIIDGYTFKTKNSIIRWEVVL